MAARYLAGGLRQRPVLSAVRDRLERPRALQRADPRRVVERERRPAVALRRPARTPRIAAVATWNASYRRSSPNTCYRRCPRAARPELLADSRAHARRAASSLRAARQVAVTSWRSRVQDRDGAARQRTRCSAPNRRSITRWALRRRRASGCPGATLHIHPRPRGGARSGRARAAASGEGSPWRASVFGPGDDGVAVVRVRTAPPSRACRGDDLAHAARDVYDAGRAA